MKVRASKDVTLVIQKKDKGQRTKMVAYYRRIQTLNEYEKKTKRSF